MGIRVLGGHFSSRSSGAWRGWEDPGLWPEEGAGRELFIWRAWVSLNAGDSHRSVGGWCGGRKGQARSKMVVRKVGEVATVCRNRKWGGRALLGEEVTPLLLGKSGGDQATSPWQLGGRDTQLTISSMSPQPAPKEFPCPNPWSCECYLIERRQWGRQRCD